jgi:hypothetical protein
MKTNTHTGRPQSKQIQDPRGWSYDSPLEAETASNLKGLGVVFTGGSCHRSNPNFFVIQYKTKAGITKMYVPDFMVSPRRASKVIIEAKGYFDNRTFNHTKAALAQGYMLGFVFNAEVDVLTKPLYKGAQITVAQWFTNQGIEWVCSPKQAPDLLARLLAKKGGAA